MLDTQKNRIPSFHRAAPALWKRIEVTPAGLWSNSEVHQLLSGCSTCGHFGTNLKYVSYCRDVAHVDRSRYLRLQMSKQKFAHKRARLHTSMKKRWHKQAWMCEACCMRSKNSAQAPMLMQRLTANDQAKGALASTSAGREGFINQAPRPSADAARLRYFFLTTWPVCTACIPSASLHAFSTLACFQQAYTRADNRHEQECS